MVHCNMLCYVAMCTLYMVYGEVVTHSSCCIVVLKSKSLALEGTRRVVGGKGGWRTGGGV